MKTIMAGLDTESPDLEKLVFGVVTREQGKVAFRFLSK